MPDLTVTLTAAQHTRALAAIGEAVNEDDAAASTAQATAWLLAAVRQLVRQRAKRLAAADATVDNALIAEGW